MRITKRLTTIYVFVTSACATSPMICWMWILSLRFDGTMRKTKANMYNIRAHSIRLCTNCSIASEICTDHPSYHMFTPPCCAAFYATWMRYLFGFFWKGKTRKYNWLTLLRCWRHRPNHFHRIICAYRVYVRLVVVWWCMVNAYSFFSFWLSMQIYTIQINGSFGPLGDTNNHS